MILDHKHLIIRAELSNPPNSPEKINDWLQETIKTIRMQLVKELSENPIAFYCNVPGNMGLTAVAVIETSHIAMHVWDEDYPATMQLDVYSCSEFQPREIINRLVEFGPIKVEYKFIDRNSGLIEITDF